MKIAIPVDVQAAGPRAVKAYRAMLRDGVSPKMAELLACKQAPGTMGVERTTSGGLPYGALTPSALKERENANRLMRQVKGKRLL
jgi:hypothetical protein